MRIFILSLCLLMAGAPLAQAADCQPGAEPAILITSSESAPHFEYHLTQAQLENFKGNADIPQEAIYDVTVNAMSTGKMRVTHDVKFVTQTNPDKQVCLQASQIKVHIHIDPVIYIAKELHSAACEYKEYLLHEMKHVEVDRKLVEDYKAVITRNMAFAFPNVTDYSVGPVPVSLTKDARQVLNDNIAGALQATIDSMMRERGDRQRAIDSTGEYQRLSAACPQNGPGVKPELRK